ncbi:MAG: DUF1801 domain-containing protein [Candidatus Ryanbacteria bacterium]|nr:DUF1801 domain-containing protein [Candidatus Ryanbacteria bacterium]
MVTMAENKTQKTAVKPETYIKKIPNLVQRADAERLLKIFKDVTDLKPAMWGPSIVGFGQYHYKSERSTQEGDWPLTGFSARKQNTTIYIMGGFKPHAELLKKIGPHKKSVSCLYIKRLSDIHEPTLRILIRKSVAYMRKTYKV